MKRKKTDYDDLGDYSEEELIELIHEMDEEYYTQFIQLLDMCVQSTRMQTQIKSLNTKVRNLKNKIKTIENKNKK